MSDLVEWLTNILDEDEQIATEASRHDDEPIADGGEHWHWACNEHDQEVVPDPLVDEFMECEDECGRVSLRSREEYPYRNLGAGEGPTYLYVVKQIGTAYSARPGYDESWRP